jgi:transcriptional regulator with XRE-family HTH domain
LRRIGGMTLGVRIKQLRKEKELTQTELGKHLNVGKSTISQYETDTNMPDPEMILKIANFFNVSTDYLLGRSDKRKETLDDEPTPQEIEEIFQNQVMYQGVPMTEEEKESVKDFIRLAIKTIRAKKRDKGSELDE